MLKKILEYVINLQQDILKYILIVLNLSNAIFWSGFSFLQITQNHDENYIDYPFLRIKREFNLQLGYNAVRFLRGHKCCAERKPYLNCRSMTNLEKKITHGKTWILQLPSIVRKIFECHWTTLHRINIYNCILHIMLIICSIQDIENWK